MSTELVEGTKRSRSEDQEPEQSLKRQRVSEERQDAQSKPVEEAESLKSAVQAPDSAVEIASEAIVQSVKHVAPRQKTGRAEEKQRSRRLFGSLLGTLGQGADRTVKRRQEIEDRRKAELRQQDDTRTAKKHQDVAQLTQKRREEQWRVEEEDMRIRHRAMRNMANFLQTQTTPKLYYRPWELRPDEERKIENQRRRVEDRIDDEVEEFEARQERAKKREEQKNGVKADAKKSEEAPSDIAEQPVPDTQPDKPPEVEALNGEQQSEAPTNGMQQSAEQAVEGASEPVTEPTKHINGEAEAEDEQRVDGEEDAVLY